MFCYKNSESMMILALYKSGNDNYESNNNDKSDNNKDKVYLLLRKWG